MIKYPQLIFILTEPKAEHATDIFPADKNLAELLAPNGTKNKGQGRALEGKNVVLIHGFKAYCALLFHKGALLKDPKDILIQQTENVQAARQLRFTNLQEIVDASSIIQSYILEAIEVEKAGLEVEMKKTSEFEMPDEFRESLASDDELATAFDALTPGRQRGYLLYFSQAKQSKTRISRIEKSIPKIREGKGLND